MSERRKFTMPGVKTDGSGLICKECGCRDFRVVNSYLFQDDSKLRRRQCRHCGNIVKTVETVMPDD